MITEQKPLSINDATFGRRAKRVNKRNDLLNSVRQCEDTCNFMPVSQEEEFQRLA